MFSALILKDNELIFNQFRLAVKQLRAESVPLECEKLRKDYSINVYKKLLSEGQKKLQILSNDNTAKITGNFEKFDRVFLS